MNITKVRDDALADLAEKDSDEPALGWHAIAVLDVLDFDHQEIVEGGAVEKLKGRPSGKVREFAEYAKTKKPEERQYLLTEFAKRVKPL